MPYSHEVLVVSEPSMMGNEFGTDDERTISRVENAQYDQNSAMMSGGIDASMMSSMPPVGSCKSEFSPINLRNVLE
jgi:hypothetical protein